MNSTLKGPIKNLLNKMKKTHSKAYITVAFQVVGNNDRNLKLLRRKNKLHMKKR